MSETTFDPMTDEQIAHLRQTLISVGQLPLSIILTVFDNLQLARTAHAALLGVVREVNEALLKAIDHRELAAPIRAAISGRTLWATPHRDIVRVHDAMLALADAAAAEPRDKEGE